MSYFPTQAEFEKLAETHDAVPVYRRLLCDSLTPVSAFKRIDSGKEACLFESVVGGEVVGRYSFLAVDPSQRICASGNQVVIEDDQGSRTIESKNHLDEFRKQIE